MDKVFIYWDNSNIFHGAQHLAMRQEEGPDVRYRVRVNFGNLLVLAHADRPMEKAIVVDSVPTEWGPLKNRLEAQGVCVSLFDRGEAQRGEQDVPDRILQLQMLRDFADYNGDPGVVVLLTGDGAGFYEGTGFHADVERMHRRGWKVEILSWGDACNQRMKEWAEENGAFISLDDYYEAVTFLEPSRPGFPLAQSRDSGKLDLSRRPMSK